MMANALQNFEDSPAFIVFFVVAFPFIFVAIGSGVLWITSKMSGWSRLAGLYRYENEEVTEWMRRGGGGVYSAKLPNAGMRGRLAVGAARNGIVVKPPFILRPFHPPLFLPFDKIVAEEDRRLLNFDLVILTMADAQDARVGILKSAREMVEKARGQ